MRIISESFGRLTFWLFGFTIILMRVPPFNFLTDSPLFNSFSIAGYILLSIFIFRLWENFIYRRKSAIPILVSLPVGLFFLSQSLSLVAAVNVNEFVANYKDLVFAVLLFFVAFWEIDSKKKFYQTIRVLAVSVIISLIIEAIVYFQLPIEAVLTSFFTHDYIKDLKINADRDRYFVDSYDAALIPLLFIFMAKSKKLLEKAGYMLIATMVAVFSFLSNFRAQLIVFALSFISSSYLYHRKFSKFLLLLPIILIVLFLINFATSAGIGYNALDRLVEPGHEDYLSVTDRFYYWGLASEMGRSSPVFGVGLGNFYDHLPGTIDANYSLFDPKNDFFKITWVHPHNVFFGVLAETGFLGLAALFILLGVFIKIDTQAILKNKSLTVSLLIVSFWMLFFFSLINPPLSFGYQGLFWLIRALIVISIANKEFTL